MEENSSFSLKPSTVDDGVSGHFSQDHLLGFEALLEEKLAPPVPSSTVTGRRRIEELKFRPPAAFEEDVKEDLGGRQA